MVVRFIFRKNPRYPDRVGRIVCRVTVDGESAAPFTTKVQCLRPQWDAKTQRLRVLPVPKRLVNDSDEVFTQRVEQARAEREHADRQNKKLRAIELELDELGYKLMEREGRHVTAHSLVTAYKEGGRPNLLQLFDLFLVERAQLVGVEISPATLTVDRTRRRLLERFLRGCGELGLRSEAFTVDVCDRFVHWLRLSEGNGHDYSQKCLGSVQQVLLWGMKREHVAENPMRHYVFKKGATKDLVYLEREELNRVTYYPFALAALQRAAACFVFQCWTGLAYADLCNLNLRRDVQVDTDGRRWVRLVRQKSQLEKPLECLVPLLPEAERILTLYQQTLPVISNQKYNRHLKEVAAICGLSVERLTTHVGRKTAGVLLLNAGVRMEVVSRILGHTDVRTTQRLYAKILDRTIQLDIRRVFGEHRPEALPEATRPLGRVGIEPPARYYNSEQRRGLPLDEPLAYTPQLPDTGRLPVGYLDCSQQLEPYAQAS